MTTATTVTAKERRFTMIENEITELLDVARDFCFTHYEDDMEQEAMDAIKIAAHNLAYRYQYYNVLKDQIIYYPSCQRLITSRDLIDEAEKQYYDDDDEFPPEYSKAIRTVVFDNIEKKKKKMMMAGDSGGNKSSVGNNDNDADDDNDNENYEMMAKLGSEWTEALES
jgi:hypothetical protein